VEKTIHRTPKPPWLKKKLRRNVSYGAVASLLRSERLHSVCTEALCPNRGECFSRGTATFLILGGVCTRNCRFCAIRGGVPSPPDPDEPRRVAEAVSHLGLDYVVVTSVTRDDLPDGGAGHFAETVAAIRRISPGTRVEVLIPDFRGDESALGTVLDARPDVLNHNIETVPRLYPGARPGADYRRSLELLERVSAAVPSIPTKTGLMLGMGETHGEVRDVLSDVLGTGCRMLTLGQYLQPSPGHLPVERYVAPREFDRWRGTALDMGFEAVASGPFVRSSYRAGEMFAAVAPKRRPP